MKTDQPYQSAPVFLQTVSVALAQLKQHLQHQYDQGYPDLHELIHIVLDDEEAKAWELTLFPHLLLPDMVEAHLASLNLHPAKTKRGDLFASRHSETETAQPAFALCG